MKTEMNKLKIRVGNINKILMGSGSGYLFRPEETGLYSRYYYNFIIHISKILCYLL